jgi:hypothetical protein
MTKLEGRAQWSEVMAALRVHSRVPDAAQILFGGTPQGPDTKSRKQPHAK